MSDKNFPIDSKGLKLSVKIILKHRQTFNKPQKVDL